VIASLFGGRVAAKDGDSDLGRRPIIVGLSRNWRLRILAGLAVSAHVPHRHKTVAERHFSWAERHFSLGGL
jgi:hypothetical protein